MIRGTIGKIKFKGGGGGCRPERKRYGPDSLFAGAYHLHDNQCGDHHFNAYDVDRDEDP